MLAAADGPLVAKDGAQNGIRTRDLILTKDVLYRLSYLGPENDTTGAPLALT